MDDDAARTLEFGSSGAGSRTSRERSFCLIVIDGPEKGATFSLATGVHSIGRAPTCDIVIQGSGVSRLHANLHVKAHGDVVIEDLQSTNGVFLDGQKVSGSLMEPGQTLMIGPEIGMRLELASPSLQILLSELYRNATRDALTGLFSRRGFEERVEVEFAMVRRHRFSSCLAVLDLDRFKAVNDSEGHDAGDVVLRALGKLLESSLRVGDLACRWGGEEFTLYLRQTDLAGAHVVLERIRERLADTDIPLPKGHTLRVTMSAGVVDLLSFQNWRHAFQCADEALYQAKSEGRNRIVCHPG